MLMTYHHVFTAYFTFAAFSFSIFELNQPRHISLSRRGASEERLAVTEVEEMQLVEGEMWDLPLVDIVRFNPAAGIHSIAKVPSDLAETWPVPPGFACPVRHLTREPFDAPLRYLLSLHDRGRYSAQTNRAYAYGMKPALEALEIEGRPFEYMDDDVLTTVVNSLAMGRGRLGEPITGATIECYLRAIGRCAAYTNDQGLTSISLDIEAHVARGWGVASMKGSGGKRIDTAPLRTHMIRPLAKSTRDRIQASLLMDAAQWHPDGPSSRPGVEFANGCRNGLRLIENLGVMVDVVQSFTVTDPNEEMLFPILRTKGCDHRNVWVFGRDVLRWQAYAAHERKACVAAAREIHGANWDEPRELLVNGLSSGLHVGAATQPSTIQRDFRVVQQRLGMFETIVVPGNDRPVVVMWHCYHDLRHSYAHAMYRAAKRRKDEFADDPISFVKIRLGHSDIATTSRIYLWPDLRKVASIGDHAIAAVRAQLNG